jgi:phosphoglucosamine mutase
VLDAANGAARLHAARLLRNLGAEVHAIGEGEGDGINDGCGAVHPERMCAEVRSVGADAGLALDGDADRVVLCDGEGAVLDGDAILWLLARGPVAVGTIMSNEGLARGLAARGTTLVRVPVGDAHVARGMVEHDASIGAEPSGHVLFADGLPTGCGLLAGLRALAAGGVSLRSGMVGYAPTFQAHGKAAVAPLEPLAPAIARIEAEGGRVVARKSGTEPIVRVMVEHVDPAQARAGLDTLLGILGAEP